MYKKYVDKISKNTKLIFTGGIILILFVYYSIYLFKMQVVNGEDYRNKSKVIKSQSTYLPAQRGEIYDIDATIPLVVNNESFAIEVTPANIPKKEYDTVMMRLANILKMPKAEIDKKIPKDARRSYASIQLKTNVSFSTVSNIAENLPDLPGVTWVSKPIRNYAFTTKSLSHLVGYVGDITQDEINVLFNQGYNQNSIVGKTGIEKQYDSLLQGTPGYEMYTVDVHGRVLNDRPPIIQPPVSGKNLVLTIDSRIQKLVEDTVGDRVGASVVLKPATGEVVAMVSYPYYDSNIFNSDNAGKEYARLLEDKQKPLLNRAVQVSYPPASTFKIIMSAAMLQEKTFSPTKKIDCSGEMEYGNHIFHCHLHSGHGYLDLKNGLAQSCDVYYWTVGRDYLGINKISSYAKEFGLGSSAQIDLPSQVTGRVPTAEWKEKTYHEKWMGGDTMSCSIGQGFMEATPLQLANMIAMVANSGVIYKPHLLKEVRDPVTNEVVQTIEPEILTQSTIDKSVWRTVQDDLRYVVTNGTPQYPMFNKTVKIACKTGTAEVTGYKDTWHSWLVAYAPYDAPPEDQICVATVIEACNIWEWWAPYATNIIIQGYFNNQNFDQSVDALGFRYLVDKHIEDMKKLNKGEATNSGSRGRME